MFILVSCDSRAYEVQQRGECAARVFRRVRSLAECEVDGVCPKIIPLTGDFVAGILRSGAYIRGRTGQ